MSKSLTVLKVDSSARREGSVTRRLADRAITELGEGGTEVTTIIRDVAAGLPVVDEAWVAANFTDPAERNADQKARLALSDTLVAEVKAADVLLIGVPIYNFGIPAALKAWVDLIARARETFRYTENGPEGLLTDKRAILLLASGGTTVGSEIDFATGYLKHIMSFIGITDVTVIAADRLMFDAEESLAGAERGVSDAAIRLRAA
ncbi:NAD(P)H-dependent oxidoreductase [Stappia stellulata]|uniref:FMN-dependent NADH-azoreductase n=1 Tax=Stappia stellulata TaxID=71235 RepID=UPI001CD71E7F|nr:NAD(P)H-dependent oxidoreductase [Stappia stellulata]MCA1243757.1 NAD(P)H-dependent oxidoreductase [Stappia stellulata]